MDRYDWTSVGLRLIGAWMFVNAVAAAPITFGIAQGAAIVGMLLSAVAGWLLFFFAQTICDWSRAREDPDSEDGEDDSSPSRRRRRRS